MHEKSHLQELNLLSIVYQGFVDTVSSVEKQLLDYEVDFIFKNMEFKQKEIEMLSAQHGRIKKILYSLRKDAEHNSIDGLDTGHMQICSKLELQQFSLRVSLCTARAELQQINRKKDLLTQHSSPAKEREVCCSIVYYAFVQFSILYMCNHWHTLLILCS